jgi:hypothetical protein
VFVCSVILIYYVTFNKNEKKYHTVRIEITALFESKYHAVRIEITTVRIEITHC